MVNIMYGYIYLTTNNINGKQYIGQKKSNVFLNEKYLGSGKALKLAIEKYGKENFTVELLEKCETEQELNDKEIYWIDFYNAVKDHNFYNEKSGGSGFTSMEISQWMSGKEKSVEHKQHISESHKGVNNPFYGKQHSKETKEKISNSVKQNHWNYGNKYNKAYFEGHNHSNETKEKIRKSLTGRKRGKCLNNGSENKIVKESEIPFYLENGWKFGMIHKNK